MNLNDVKNAIISAESDFGTGNRLVPHIIGKIKIDGDDVNIMCDGIGDECAENIHLINYGLPSNYKLAYNEVDHDNLKVWWNNRSGGHVLDREYSYKYESYKVNVQLLNGNYMFNFHYSTT